MIRYIDEFGFADCTSTTDRGLGHFMAFGQRQRATEGHSSRDVVLGDELPLVSVNDGTTQRQSQAEAGCFARDEGLENRAELIRRDPGPHVLDGKLYPLL